MISRVSQNYKKEWYHVCRKIIKKEWYHVCRKIMKKEWYHVCRKIIKKELYHVCRGFILTTQLSIYNRLFGDDPSQSLFLHLE